VNDDILQILIDTEVYDVCPSRCFPVIVKHTIAQVVTDMYAGKKTIGHERV
jgi:hypothetical protein